MALTLAQAQAVLTAYQSARTAILDGAQEYWIGSRRIKRADLAVVEQMITKYQALVDALTAGRTAGVRVMRVMPRDL